MNRYVLDTVGFINFFNVFFGEKDILSKSTRKTIERCFSLSYNNYKLIIPSVVFIEIHKKFLKTEEDCLKFYYEIYSLVQDSEDIEVKPIEKEVLEIFSNISQEHSLELHDRIVFSSAIQLEAPLITNDSKILKANRDYRHEIIF